MSFQEQFDALQKNHFHYMSNATSQAIQEMLDKLRRHIEIRINQLEMLQKDPQIEGMIIAYEHVLALVGVKGA